MTMIKLLEGGGDEIINPILLSGLIGALVGASAALASQFLAHHLARKRDDKRFQIQSFERFRREFTENENLYNISVKKEPLTEDEIDEYLGFFEEIGLYFARDLVDIELVDEILGDSITAAWEDEHLRKAVGSIRAGEDDSAYFMYFERLARHLVARNLRRRKNERNRK
jgi:hypothetical protein